MLSPKLDPRRSFSSLERLPGDGSLVHRFRFSWGSQNSRNYPYNLNKMIGKRRFRIPSAKSAAASPPICPIRGIPPAKSAAISPPIRPIRVPTPEISSEDEEDIAAASGSLVMMRNHKTIRDVTKILTASDLNSAQSRLLIGKHQMNDHVLPFMDEHSRTKIRRDGFKVCVKDYDTGEDFQLKLKWWATSQSYVFVDGWTKNFVARRGLKKGDEIGLFWNQSDRMFVFSVFRRAKALAATGSSL